MVSAINRIINDSVHLGIYTKYFLMIIIISIITTVFILLIGKLHNRKQGFTNLGNNDEINIKNDIKYILWTGNIETTLDILNLAQSLNNKKISNKNINNNNVIIQPIYIGKPGSSDSRIQYELQITKTLRDKIMLQYPRVKILPIIHIKELEPPDATFNEQYDIKYNKGNKSPTRNSILERWSRYYKIKIERPSITTDNNLMSVQKNNITNEKNKEINKSKLSKVDRKLLNECWDCRFPVGKNAVPCGLCKKCEKLAQLE